MSGIEEGLLRDVLDHPDDDGVRLIYADWLEDNGEPDRAEFIRLQIELARMDGEAPRRPTLVARERALLRAHQAEWTRGLKGIVTGFTFERGVVAWVDLPARRFLERGGQLFDLAPVEGVRLESLGDSARKLAASPLLGRLTGLRLQSLSSDVREVAVLLDTPH